MIFSTKVAALLSICGLAVGSAGQEPLATSVHLEFEVRSAIAAEWSIDPTTVVLEWGPSRIDLPDSVVSVALVGSGASGQWVARFEAQGAETAVRVRAGVHVRLMVSVSRLERGHVLALEDIAYEESVVWGPPRLNKQPDPVGWVAQRPVDIGDELRRPTVRPPLGVVSGSPVSIVWSTGTVAVTVPGVAAGSGPVGESVYVRTESGKRIRGTIVAPGVVDVSPGASRDTGEIDD